MKKFLLILFVSLALFGGCKKDTGTNVTLTPIDLANLNSQLKGSWVFPVKTLTVVDSSGKAVLPGQNLPSSAFEFDGYSKVKVKPDPTTVLEGTYTISTNSKGGIYVNIVYPDATSENYQVVLLNAQVLTLASSQPYVYYHNGQLLPTVAVTSTTLKRLNAADVTGKLVRVVVTNDSTFSIKVSLKRYKDGNTVLIDSLSNTDKSYSVAFPVESNDQLKIDVLGNIINTSINAYVKGLPISGDILNTSVKETITTTGWVIQFPN